MAAQDSKTCPGPVQKDKSLLMCLIHHPFFPEECLLNFEPNLYFSIRIIFSATKLISFESKHEICMHIPPHTPPRRGRESLQGSPPGKPSRKTFCYLFLWQNVVFGILTTLFYVFNVLLSFLAQNWGRTIMKSHQKASFGTKMCCYGKQNQKNCS